MRIKNASPTARTEAARGYGIVCDDIDACHDLAKEPLALARAVTVVGFEPDSTEAAELSRSADPRWRTICHAAAVGGADGQASRFQPSGPCTASLLRHDPAILERFGYEIPLHDGFDQAAERKLKPHRTTRNLAKGLQIVRADQYVHDSGWATPSVVTSRDYRLRSGPLTYSLQDESELGSPDPPGLDEWTPASGGKQVQARPSLGADY